MIIIDIYLLYMKAPYFEAARMVEKIGSNLKSNHHKQIRLAQFHVRHCRYCLLVWYSFIFDSFGASQAVNKTCGNLLCGRKFVYFGAIYYFCPGGQKNQHFDCPI
jgi:hypothetical protein